MKTYRTLWISDVHLGTKDCQAALLNDFLKHHHAQKLYLVGDIIDGWKMQSGIYWQKDFTRVIRRLLTLSKKGVNIDYITGNHDEFLRRFANNRFDNINLYNRVIHTTADGRKLLVLHGDQFDSVTRCHHWLRFLGDQGHSLLMALNRSYNTLRAKYGHGYWSLASFLKTHLPQAQMYIREYENGVAHAAAKQGFDGVVCGHIHHAACKRIGDVDYYNTGDWVESCTALAEDADGAIHLIHWRTANPDVLSDQPDNGCDRATPFPKSITGSLTRPAFAPPDQDLGDTEWEEEDDEKEENEEDKTPPLIIPG